MSGVSDEQRLHEDGRPRRYRECAERNPANDETHQSCCRFPKTCSPYPYDETPVTDADLEPRRAPAGGLSDEQRAEAQAYIRWAGEDSWGGQVVTDLLAEVDTLREKIHGLRHVIEGLDAERAKVEALAELMDKIDADYMAGDRATNAVTALSVAARLRAILRAALSTERGA